MGNGLARDVGCKSRPPCFSRNIANIAFWLLDRMEKCNIFGKQVRVHQGRIKEIFNVHVSLRLRQSQKFIREERVNACFQTMLMKIESQGTTFVMKVKVNTDDL